MMISVIIPAYNASKTLERAVNSVINQVYDNLEILIIENGSTDDTYRVALELAQRDPRIKVFQSEKGVSKARNFGIEHSLGEWITFLDADDILFEGSLSNITNKTSNADVVITQLDEDNKNGVFDFYYNNESSILDYLYRCMCHPTTMTTVHGLLFSNQFIKRHSIRFNEKLRLAEDSVFFILSVLKAKSIQGIKEPYYGIKYSLDSTIGSNNKSMVMDYEKSINVIKDLVDSKAYLHNSMLIFTLNQLLIIFVHDIVTLKWFQSVHGIKETCNRPLFKDAIVNADISVADLKTRIVFRLLKMKLYNCVYFIVRIRQIHNKKRYR